MKTGIAYPLTFFCAAAGLVACASQPVTEPESPDLGVLWVHGAAEYRALSLQAYRAASRDLPRLLADKTWSALPGQTDAAGLTPAIVFDVDETLVSTVDFELGFEPPFTDEKFDRWNATHAARAVPGAPEFVKLARESGVEVFFVTNRHCKSDSPADGFCPQQAIVLGDLNEAGIPADAEHLLLADERPEWTDEKRTRRHLIAKDHRLVMLVGDDLGDFLPCVRKKVAAPCTEPASDASRRAQTEQFANYWGDGWYILPNPMYGSWTAFD